MTTFNEVNKDNSLNKEITHVFWMADRPYQERDGRYVTEGNYLFDFLTQHGEEEIRPIEFKKGCPAGRGEGIIFKK